MNAAVLRQALRQSRRTVAVLALGSGAFHYLVLLSSSSFLAGRNNQFAGFFRNPPKAISAFLGGNVDFFSPAGWLAAGMSHPVTIALLTGAALTIAAGAVATELERGSLDLVLVRPIRRSSFVMGKAGAALVAVTAAEAGGFASVLVARATISRVGEIPVLHVARAFLGSWVLFGAFAMIALLVSTQTSLRGRATGTAVGVVVGSFFLNFIALLIDGISGLRYASPFHYFDPGQLVAGRELGRLVVLLALGVVALGVGVVGFARRDLTR
jgi:ABC-2 type transport system permease protein